MATTPRIPPAIGRARQQDLRRRKEAAAAFAATVEACKGDMHPDDIAFEPRNFDAWMAQCDSCDEPLLQHMLLMLKRSTVSAGPGTYTSLRTHFMKYAEAALDRRFDGPEIPF
ncbi:MAG: hypothetical protein Q7K57_61185 [Burkholderiaceae bacterium]|nr:hypothetical protein [Burkholderiaceae bacterium]